MGVQQLHDLVVIRSHGSELSVQLRQFGHVFHGKVRLRPWAEMGGRIATNATTFNRELLIVEKSNDGKPFELHTSYADKEKYYRNLRNPWLFLLLLFALFAITKHSIVLGIFSLVSAIPSILYQLQIINVRQKAKTWEQ